MNKIAVIAPSEVPSNTANSIQVMKVCQAFQDCGKEVALWIPGDGQANWDELSKYYGIEGGFNITWVTSTVLFRRYDTALKSLLDASKWGADLIYTWMPQTAILTLWINLPAALEVHMLPSGRMGPWLFKRFVASKRKKLLLYPMKKFR